MTTSVSAATAALQPGPQVPGLGAIQVPEANLLDRFFPLALDRAARDFDVAVAIHEGLAALAAESINDQPLFPGYLEENGGRGFWISVRRDGRLIGQYAVAEYDLGEKTLADHMGDPGLYRDGSHDVIHLEPEARALAAEVEGGAGFIGALFVAPQFRGSELSQFLVAYLPLLGMAASYARGATPHFFFFCKDKIAAWVGGSAGPRRMVPGVYWYRRGRLYGGTRHLGVVDAQQVVERVRGFVSAGPGPRAVPLAAARPLVAVHQPATL